jgi:hypothetical protein
VHCGRSFNALRDIDSGVPYKERESQKERENERKRERERETERQMIWIRALRQKS